MPEPVPDPRRRHFAELVAAGVSRVEAYRRAFGVDDRFAASRLARSARMAAEIRRLGQPGPKFGSAPSIAAAVTMTREELLEWYASAIRTPVGEIDENHPLALEVVREEGPRAKVRVKSVSKMEAAKALREMCGWNKPQREDTGLDGTLREALESLGPSTLIPTQKLV